MKEFVEKLREKADTFEKSGCAVDGIVKDYRKSADMIEKLCGKTNIGEFVKKLIERLEEKIEITWKCDYLGGKKDAFKEAIEIVNQLAEEYNNKSTDELISKKMLVEKIWEKRKEHEEMYDIWTQDDIKDLFCDIVALIDEFPTTHNQESTKKNQGWIPCSERLPEAEEVDVIVSTKAVGVTLGLYTKRYGYGMQEGFVTNYGFVNLKNAEAWQPLPSSYKPEEKQEETQTNFYSERFNKVN